MYQSVHTEDDHSSMYNYMMYNTKNSFPVKLHWILSNPEFESIISWLPHGRSWRVLQPEVFTKNVIPMYFRHTRFPSFMRQVNGWGFRRISEGSGENSYCHELFRKDAPLLCLRMRRINQPAKSNDAQSYDSKDRSNVRKEESLTKPTKINPLPTRIIPSINAATMAPSSSMIHHALQNADGISLNAGAAVEFEKARSLPAPNLMLSTPNLAEVSNVGYSIPSVFAGSQLRALAFQEQCLQQRIQRRLQSYVVGQNTAPSSLRNHLISLNLLDDISPEGRFLEKSTHPQWSSLM